MSNTSTSFRRRVFLGAYTDSALDVIGLPQTRQYLRATLNLYALLYDEVVTTDSVLLDNRLLRELLLGTERWDLGYDRMVREGVLVAALRDSATDFRTRLQEMRDQELHASFLTGASQPEELQSLRESQEAWAHFVDGAAQTALRYEGGILGQNFTYGIERALDDPTTMRQTGLEPLRGAILQEIDALRLPDSGLILRSHIWKIAARLTASEHDEAARALYKLSSVIYHRNAALHLSVDPALPSQLEGVRIITSLADEDDLSVPERWDKEVEEPGSPAFAPELLANIPYDVIADIRRGSAFKTYVEAAGRASAFADSHAAEALHRAALRTYMGEVEESLALASKGKYWKAKDEMGIRTISKWVSKGGGALLLVANVLALATKLKFFSLPIDIGMYFLNEAMTARLARTEKELHHQARETLNETYAAVATKKGSEP